MEPVRVIVGARETIAGAARRLRAHQASAAPVVAAGKPAGMLTRALAENALRHGLGDARVAEIAVGGAPRVAPTADLRAMKKASVGIDAGLVVGAPRGTLQGVVTRHRLEEAIRRHVPRFAPPEWLLGKDLGAKMHRVLGADHTGILRKAGGLAGAQGVGLYLAGGVVRDIMLGRPSKDLDLVVEGDGVMFAEEMGKILDARVTRHEMFGTAVIEPAAGGRIDVASARRETYDAPSALPRVTPGTLLEDLLRRDVTINSMAIHLDGARYGRLTDELAGERDLRARLLRVNHALSITEDPTRAFRIARFAARLGFSPSNETHASLALARSVRAFDALTGERLFREFSFIAAEPDPAAVLRHCAKMGLLDHLGPGLRFDAATAASITRLQDGIRLGMIGTQRTSGLAERSLLLLMLLSIRARESQRETLADRLRITGEAAERLRLCGAGLPQLLRALSPTTRLSRVARRIEQSSPDLVALAWAAGPARSRRVIVNYHRNLRAVKLSVTGETLRQLGLAPGPEFAEVLDLLRQARLDGDVKDDAAERDLAATLVRRKLKPSPRGRH